MILGVHVTRQLWIQLRLLGLLTLPILAAVAAVTVFGQTGSASTARLVLAIGFALATVVGAALVATGFGEEIRSGAAAWLAVRAVPRTSLIGAWLVVPAAAVAGAFVLAGILAGLAIPSAATTQPDPLTIVIGVLAAAAPVVPLSALGLAIAVEARGLITAALVIGLAALVAVPLALLGDAAIHPASGFWLVAGLGPSDRPITVGLQAIGLCLALAAVGWLWAARRFSRHDL